MFRCADCHGPLGTEVFDGPSHCPHCQRTIDNIDGVPLLVKNRQRIEQSIAAARQQGRDTWYTQPQLNQWIGPYRHHIRKRKLWIEGVLAAWKAARGQPTAIGLDLGCGDGSNLQWLHTHFSALYASDYNMLRLQRAAKLGTHARLFMADVCDFPTKDDAFDVIVFNHVLEHIPDDAAALSEVRRILKPKGLLILGVPNEGEAFWQLAYRLQPKSRMTSDHCHHYTADSLAAKCAAAGLRVQYVHRMGWGVPHWTLDALIRRFKWVDDGLEMLGRRFFSSSGDQPVPVAVEMNARFHFVGRQDVGREKWDALADEFKEAWLWHCFDFQDALATWVQSRDESFAVVDGGEIVALVPLRRITRRLAGLLPVYVLESFGGAALKNGIGERHRRAVLTAVREHLQAHAKRGICLETRLSLPPMAPAWRGADCPRVNPLLEMGCDNILTQTWVVDLRPGRTAVWARMEGRARTAVRKAEKAGVKVRAARDDDLDTYERLREETFRRTGVQRPAQTREYFRVIWEKFLLKGRAAIWIAELDGEPVAAENFGIYKRAAIYWTGAASRKGLEVEANSLLQWTAMQWMIERGVEWYETGEAFPHLDSGKNKGLSDFKKSFGGTLFPYYKGRMFNGTMWEKLYRCARELGRAR